MNWVHRILLSVLLIAGVGGGVAGCGPLEKKDWKTQANEGIERYRKRDVEVRVVDARGKPVRATEVQIDQTRKAFPFGSAISARILNTPRWQEEFKKYFSYAVLENESKWTSNERVQGRVNYQQADAIIRWCETNGIKVRGHCIFWEHTGDAQAWPLWLNTISGDAFKQALEKRLTDATSHFKGHFVSWDVDNEMLHGTFFIDHAGKDARVWMYQRARELDPGVKLFTNEFNVLSVDKNFEQVQTDAYVAQVREMIKAGAPIDCVGIQGHVWNEDILATPDVIRERLDKVATLGLPIWISEFDVADADDKVRADKLELVYRTAYSHPAVHGIMMWIFWAGNSWRGPTAGLFDTDWTMNEEGKRFASLMAEWSTSAHVRSDDQGRARFRGFFGSYHAGIAGAGRVAGSEFEVEEGKGAQIVTLKVQE